MPNMFTGNLAPINKAFIQWNYLKHYQQKDNKATIIFAK